MLTYIIAFLSIVGFVTTVFVAAWVLQEWLG
jgi:hypothetical protein